MSCRTEAGVERNTARAISTCVPRAATATRLLNRVLGVYGYSGFRRESKIAREVVSRLRLRRARHRRICVSNWVLVLGVGVAEALLVTSQLRL